jgi:hypothetical protein
MGIAQQTRLQSWNEVQLHLGFSQNEVLSIVKKYPNGVGPWTVAAILGRPVYQIRPRFTELAELGFISEIGKNYSTPTRKPETVYRAVDSEPNGQLRLCL